MAVCQSLQAETGALVAWSTSTALPMPTVRRAEHHYRKSTTCKRDDRTPCVRYSFACTYGAGTARR